MMALTLLSLLSACSSDEGLYTQEEVDALIEQAVSEALTESEGSDVTTTTTPSPTTTATRATTTSAAVSLAEADIADFSIELIVLEKQCFGSAGCNVTVEPELSYVGPPLPRDAEYTLIYDVLGGEDGAVTLNLDIEGSEYSFNQELISTANSEDELTVQLVRLLSR